MRLDIPNKWGYTVEKRNSVFRKGILLMNSSRPGSGMLYDMHNHSLHSHDAKSDIAALCEIAIQSNIAGFAVTDHFDNEYSKETDTFSSIAASFKDAGEKQKLYGEKVDIIRGVEIGEGIWFPEEAEKMIGLCDFDVVLGSVHAVRYKNLTAPYSVIDFSKVSKADVTGFWGAYFDDLAACAETMDYDILTHLTCPLRYINGKFGYSLSPETHADKIESILKTVISRGKALEINTSCLGSHYDELMPGKFILERYYALGGQLVTVGSDSHIEPNFAKGLEKAVGILKEIGFDKAYYYKKRKAYAYTL